MCKPILLTILSSLAAVVIVLLCPLHETISCDGELTTLGQQIPEELDLDTRLHVLSARTLDRIQQRRMVIADLLEERVSLDQARAEFRRLNDQNPACWDSLRAAWRGCSDEQCLDLQLRTHLNVCEPTPDQRRAHKNLMTRLGPLLRVDGE